jgi:hypothetical protein
MSSWGPCPHGTLCTFPATCTLCSRCFWPGTTRLYFAGHTI